MSGGQPRRGAALVVGVGRYQHDGIAPLTYAADDAEAIADLLADPDVCHFPPEQIATLIDEAASRDAIIHHLTAWLPDKARGAEVVVLYFAGHGTVCHVGAKAEGYFLSHDADPDNPTARGVAMGDVARCMDGLDAAAVVLCLDCCHAGKVLYRDPVRRDMAIRPAHLQPIAGKGRYLLASCDEGQFSIELPDLKHGLFTHHLLHGLRGRGDLDGDGRVGVEELFGYVAREVEADAQKQNVRQRPWMSLVAATGTYLAAPRPAGAGATGATIGGFERVRLDDGPAAAVREIEARLAATTDEAAIVHLLKQLGRLADPAGVPALFRALGHDAPAVQLQAKRGIQAVGIERSFQAILDLARAPDPAVLEPIIRGLNAYEAEPRLVALLDQLVNLLHGDLLLLAAGVLDHKRLGVGLATMAALFREMNTGYELLRVLGQGLFAAAYEARARFSGHRVVVRVLRPEFAQQAAVRKEFLDLCRDSIPLIHQNLVVTRQGEELPDRQIYYVVRDLVAGTLLRDMIAGGRRFSAAEAVAVLKQILAALRVVHVAKLRHGGVKPSNIFVCDPDDHVVLGDLAPAPQGVGSAVAVRLAYDYRYAAPEVLQMLPAGSPADVYALGCVAYEMLTGRPPYAADGTAEEQKRNKNNYMLISAKHLTQPPPAVTPHRPDLPHAADVVIAGLMAKAAADRPVGRDVEKLLERLLEPPPRRAAAPPPVAPPRPAASYQPIVSALSIGATRNLQSIMAAGLDSLAPAESLFPADPFVPPKPPEPPKPPAQPKPVADPSSEFELTLDGIEPPAARALPVAPDAGDKSEISETNFDLPPESDAYDEDSDFDSEMGVSTDEAASEVELDDESFDRPPPANPPTLAAAPPPDPAATAGPGAAAPAPSAIPAELLTHPSYAEVRELGRGGMGTVYLARNTMLDRPEVLKVMRRFDNEEVAERFRREMRAIAQLNHPNIVRAYSSFRLGEQFVLAMEYVNGPTLTDLVRRQGPLPVRQACHFIRQAALGLQHAHEAGMVHRDIKPSNLMLNTEGRRTVVKVLDFGLARVTGDTDARATRTGVVMGTPHYMAPEQVTSAADADIRADIYALGASLYFLLAGQSPFEGKTVWEALYAVRHEAPPPLRSHRPDILPALAAVVDRMLAKQAADRYQTPREVVEALAPFLGREDVPPTPPARQTADSRAAMTIEAARPRDPWWQRVRRWFRQ